MVRETSVAEKGIQDCEDGLENLFRLFGVLYEIDKENRQKAQITTNQGESVSS